MSSLQERLDNIPHRNTWDESDCPCLECKYYIDMSVVYRTGHNMFCSDHEDSESSRRDLNTCWKCFGRCSFWALVICSDCEALFCFDCYTGLSKKCNLTKLSHPGVFDHKIRDQTMSGSAGDFIEMRSPEMKILHTIHKVYDNWMDDESIKNYTFDYYYEPKIFQYQKKKSDEDNEEDNVPSVTFIPHYMHRPIVWKNKNISLMYILFDRYISKYKYSPLTKNHVNYLYEHLQLSVSDFMELPNLLKIIVSYLI